MTGVASDKNQSNVKDYEITSNVQPEIEIEKKQFTNKNLRENDSNMVGLNQNEDVSEN
jgi:hypothetical protein